MSYSQSQYSRGSYNDAGYRNNRQDELPPINKTRYSENNEAYQQRGGQNGNYDNDNRNGGRAYGSTGQYESNSPQMNYDTQDGQPLQLILADPRSGRFTLNEDVAAELMNYEGNISFVTVAGKYRTGKSFLLNKLLNLKGEGFTVDPTTDACTQGVWIWSKPIYNERDNVHIFFLDTEGSNSVEKSATHDAKIFSLSLLMSSYFIYNSVGNIDENSINDLSLTTQLSRNIAISTEENSEQALSFYTPKFLWALRDFTLELQDARGKAISANQYLENALTDQSTYSKTTETNKKIRQALLNYFKDRECMTFVRPANDERELRKLNSLSNNQIRPDFLKQVNFLREKIFAKANAKQLKGVNLNMRMYIAMLHKYVEAINSNSVPNISTAWEHLVDNECREAYERSVELYEVALKQFFFNEDRAKSVEDLYNILKSLRDSTLEKYNKITAAIERNDVAQDFKNELKSFIDTKEQAVFAINEELNQANNEDLLRQYSQIIKDNITSGAYGPSNIQSFYDDYDQFLSNYDNEGQGMSKNTNLVHFLKNFQPDVIDSLVKSLNKTVQTNQRNYEQAQSRANENEKNLKMNLEVLRSKEQNTVEELQRIKQERNELTQKTNKLNEQIQKIKGEEETKLLRERERNMQELNRLKEKEDEVRALAEKNQKLMTEIANAKKKKNACGGCNIF